MMPRIRVATLLVLLSGSALSSQTATPPAPQAPQAPTFRLNVEYVEVDAVVTDRDGQFVRGLAKDDFQIFEDGKPQPISTFAVVDIPVERAQRPLGASNAIEPDVKSNERPFEGRIYVMLVDDLHTYFGRTPRVRAAARQFIQQNLGANDLMAVVHTAGPSDASQEFTSNKRLLLAAVDRTMGRKLDSATVTKTDEYFRQQSSGRQTGDPLTDPLDAERQTNARQSLDALKNIAEWFSTVRGRRKTILFVSEGIDYDITDFGNSGASLIMDSTRETLAAAARGNVSIYGIDPRGLTSLADQSIEVGSFPDDTSLGLGNQSLMRELQLSQSSLRQLSDDTGGFAVVNKDDFATAFDRIVRDNSSYYAMAYYPPSDKAGKFHKIEVRVRRPDLRVRARQGYVTPKPASPVKEKSPAAATGNLTTPKLREVLDSPLPVSGLAMKVFATPFKGVAPNASVLLGVELRGRDLRLDPTDKVAVTYAVVDHDGKIRAGSTDSLAMTLKPETKTRVAASGLRLLERVDLPPGRYQVRVAAHDQGGGNAGSVVADLEVPDFAKLPFSMSGVALTSASAVTAPTVRPDELLRQVMPGPPVAARSFPQNDDVALFVEVYDNEAARPHKVDITTTVTSDEGKVVTKAEEARDSSELQGRRGGYGYAARLLLKDLPPGPYVLTVSARSRLGDTPPAERQVAFTVTAASR
jgi:VWFA-related protein